MRRVIDLTSAQDTTLRALDGNLVVTHGKKRPTRIKLPTVDAVIIGPTVSLNGYVLSSLCAHGASVIMVGDRFRPVGFMGPADSHGTTLLDRQMAMSYEKKVELWRDVCPGLPMAATTDMAVYAAMVLRAMVLRALWSYRIHPAFGIRPREASESYGLADDLAEPMHEHLFNLANRTENWREAVLDAALGEALVGSEFLVMSEACLTMCRSYAEMLSGKRKDFLVWRTA